MSILYETLMSYLIVNEMIVLLVLMQRVRA
jgi:hypothetical protein